MRVIPISAPSEEDVKRQAQALAEDLSSQPILNGSASWDAIVHTLCARRSRFAWSAAIPASSPDALRHKLSNNDFKAARRSEEPSLAFVFTGQGAQWAAMGKDLIHMFPQYRRTLEEIGWLIKKFGADWDIISKSSNYILFLGLLIAIQLNLNGMLRLPRSMRRSTASHCAPPCRSP